MDAALARLTQLYPKLIDLSLGRTHRLLGDLGNPHHRLPPVIHVAGTNGKGSTVAMMRAVLEAAGGSVLTPEGEAFVYGKADEKFRNGWFVARGK